VNLPNSITTSRIVCVPVLIWLLSPSFPFHDASYGQQEIIASLVFIAASITDGVDGYLARRRQIVSVVATILAHRWYEWHFGWFTLWVYPTAITAIYFMVVVSIISAIDYFVAFWRKIDRASTVARVKAGSVLSRKKNISTAN